MLLERCFVELVIRVLALLARTRGKIIVVSLVLDLGLLLLFLAASLSLDILNHDLDVAALFGELDGIGLQVDKHLFDALLLGADHMVLVLDMNRVLLAVAVLGTCFCREVHEVCQYSYAFRHSLIDLDFHYLCHCFLDVEWLGVLDEAIVLDLCITKNVLNVEK